MSLISSTAKIHPNVKIGKNVVIGDYVVIGEPTKKGSRRTIIGDGAHIRSHTVIYAGNIIGENFQTGHGVLIREENKIGNRVSIGSGSTIEHHVVLERGVRIHSNAFIPEFSILKKGCWIGPGVVLTNAYYPTSVRAKSELRGVTIGEGARIGANASLLPGVNIGKNALIGTGSVVINNVGNNKVAAGNPAREVNDVRNITAYESVLSRIPLADLKAQYQSVANDVMSAVKRVLESGSYILGTEVKEFEALFSSYIGTKFCVGVSSGTSAVHLALEALGVGPGDEVITSAFTFIATAEAIRHTGAKPVLVDINPKNNCMNPVLLQKAINSRTKAIVVVHLHGHSAEMDEIIGIAKKNRLFVIEDAAQAHGARYKGRMVGSLGDAGCFSFFPAKNLGAYGDAGAIVTNNPKLASKVALLRDHGRTEKYRHDEHGYNHRIDALQAAILKAKIPYLDGWNEKRRAIAKLYNANFNPLVKIPAGLEMELPVYHQYIIRTRQRDRLKRFLKEKGIDTGIHYPLPLHFQPALAYLKYKRGVFPESEKLAHEVLSLPVFPEMTAEQVKKVIRCVSEFFIKKNRRA